jgi:surface protein
VKDLKRLVSGLLCSVLVFGLVNNHGVLNSYAEENVVTSESLESDNQVEQSSTMIDSETEEDVSEFVPNTSKEETVSDNQTNSSNSTDNSKEESTTNDTEQLPNSSIMAIQEGFDLEEWEYQENENEIILISHKGTAEEIVIPGEINVNNIGKHVVLQNLSVDTVGNPISLTIQEINGKKVGLQSTNLMAAFYLARLRTLDFSGLDTSNVTNMAQMFYQSDLQSANFLGMDTSNVTDMSQMFTYTDLTNFQQDFNTSNVTDMHNMFAGLSSSPKQLEVNNFDMSNVTNVRRMFAAIPSILYYDLSNWHFGKTDVNFDQMFATFGASAYKPLLVVTTDSQLLAQNFNYDSGSTSTPATRYRSPAGPYFDGGSAYNESDSIGLFSNGNRFQRFFTDFFVQPDDPKLDLNKLKKFIINQEQTIPILTPAAAYDFTGYTLNSGGIDSQDATQITDLFNNIYTAQWLNQKINSSGDNQNFTPNSSLLGFAYLPKAFDMGTVTLQSGGRQEIPLKKTESLNIGVKDRTNSYNEWTVTATFNWTSGMEISDAYIQANNQSGTIMDNWNTGDYAYNPSADLHPLSSNDVTGIPDFELQVNQTVVVMSTNTTTRKNGIYDYDLGNAVLVIPDVSQVVTGTYLGEVHWNLINGPS